MSVPSVTRACLLDLPTIVCGECADAATGTQWEGGGNRDVALAATSYAPPFPLRSSSPRTIASAISFFDFRRCRLWR